MIIVHKCISKRRAPRPDAYGPLGLDFSNTEPQLRDIAESILFGVRLACDQGTWVYCFRQVVEFIQCGILIGVLSRAKSDIWFEFTNSSSTGWISVQISEGEEDIAVKLLSVYLSKQSRA